MIGNQKVLDLECSWIPIFQDSNDCLSSTFLTCNNLIIECCAFLLLCMCASLDCISLCLVVGIQFANDFYEVDEGNPLLEVCIILTGEISTSISVTLTSTTLTATRKITCSDTKHTQYIVS